MLSKAQRLAIWVLTIRLNDVTSQLYISRESCWVRKGLVFRYTRHEGKP